MLLSTSCKTEIKESKNTIVSAVEINKLLLQMNANLEVARIAYDSSINMARRGEPFEKVNKRYGSVVLLVWQQTRIDLDNLNLLCRQYSIDSVTYKNIFDEIEFDKVERKIKKLESFGMKFELKN